MRCEMNVVVSRWSAASKATRRRTLLQNDGLSSSQLPGTGSKCWSSEFVLAGTSADYIRHKVLYQTQTRTQWMVCILLFTYTFNFGRNGVVG